MLADVRVLDLSTELGLMCGQLLADMGADVQQWVTPADAPKLDDDPHWRAYTAGKGVTVVDWRGDPDAVREQVRYADVLIESEQPGALAALGLGPDALAAINPGLIYVSISGFGGTGPKSRYRATDLIATAASGHLYVTGAADRAPVRITCPQAHGHASADAAVAVLIALLGRDRSGAGQHIDVSAQQSTTLALLNRALDGAVGQPRANRSAYGMVYGDVHVRNQYQAADGWVVVLPGILPPIAPFMERLMAWVHELGLCREADLRWPWGRMAAMIMAGEVRAADWEPVQTGIERLVASRTKAELMREAVARRLLIAPVFTVADLLESEHLRARGYVSGHRLGAFARLAESPLPLTRSRPARWSSAPERPTADGREGRPLDGVKILDLFWVVAGPGATRMLADYGATVVHVESSRRQDMVRNVPPYIDGVVDPERAACHHSTNANKLNITLDLGQEAGREVLRDLVRWADVFTESFAPGAIARMGFDYASVRSLNPDIIMISSCLMGQTGEWSPYAGYGNLAAAVSGFHALTGHADQPPMGCFGPYTDFTSVRFNALAILGALRHRARTGGGQYIDMAQAEAALHFLAPECLGYLESGVVRSADGNRDAVHVPHGVYPVAGDDRWLALAVTGDGEWRALCRIAGFAELAGLDRAARRAREDELDARIAAWTAGHAGDLLERDLQAAGVPAHRVLDTVDLHGCPQLAHRGHFIPVAHRNFPNAVVESSRIRLSGVSPVTPRVAPWFGVDNETVLGDLLGYDADRRAALAAEGVLA